MPRRSSCGSCTGFGRAFDALAGLDGLYVAAPGRAEVAVGAEPQQEIVEGLEGEFAARGARVVAPVGLGEEEPAGARLVAAVDPGDIVCPGVVLVLGGEIVAQRTKHAHLRRL